MSSCLHFSRFPVATNVSIIKSISPGSIVSRFAPTFIASNKLKIGISLIGKEAVNTCITLGNNRSAKNSSSITTSSLLWELWSSSIWTESSLAGFPLSFLFLFSSFCLGEIPFCLTASFFWMLLSSIFIASDLFPGFFFGSSSFWTGLVSSSSSSSSSESSSWLFLASSWSWCLLLCLAFFWLLWRD